jgi:hypothetical protein
MKTLGLLLIILLLPLFLLFRPAESTESLYYLPQRDLGTEHFNYSAEILELQKKVDAYQETKDYFLHKSASARAKKNKVFWLTIAINEDIQLISSLKLVFVMKQEQQKHLNERLAKNQAEASSEKLHLIVTGMDAMLETLSKMNSGDTSFSEPAENADALVAIRTRLEIINKSFLTVPAQRIEQHSDVKDKYIIEKLDRHLVFLKTLHAKLSRGKVI